jgi:hypothetical protein
MAPVVISGEADLNFPHKYGKAGELFTKIGNLTFGKFPASAIQ